MLDLRLRLYSSIELNYVGRRKHESKDTRVKGMNLDEARTASRSVSRTNPKKVVVGGYLALYIRTF